MMFLGYAKKHYLDCKRNANRPRDCPARSDAYPPAHCLACPAQPVCLRQSNLDSCGICDQDLRITARFWLSSAGRVFSRLSRFPARFFRHIIAL